MKKRGTYLILTGCGSSGAFGGPSWESEGAGPTFKEILSNELSVSPLVQVWTQEIGMKYGRSNNPFQCDFGDDTDTDIFGDVPVTGLPMKDVKSFVHEKLSNYDCNLPIQVEDYHELWSSYKTLNFKKFLMSRGFDVEIVDWDDVAHLTTEPVSFMRGLSGFKDNYQEITGKDPKDIEYILIVGAPSINYTWSGGWVRDSQDRYTGEFDCNDGALGIMESQMFEGADEGDENNNTDSHFAKDWYDHSYESNDKLTNAIVGRWSITNHQGSWSNGIDIAWRILNTIEYHTNEAQKHVYYNPSLVGGDFDKLLVGYCSRSACLDQESCEANGYKWMEPEPGYQYERIMGAYNNSVLTNVSCNPNLEDDIGDDRGFNLEDPYGLASYSAEGIDFEPPVSRNPEFVKRYERGVKKEEYIQLMREAAEWNEANPSPREEDEFGCDEGYYWDIVEERCRIESSGGGRPGPFYSPANAINWLRRRWDDLGLYMLMWGSVDTDGGYPPGGFAQHIVRGTSVFQYRGAGNSDGPGVPDLKEQTWGESTDFDKFQPMFNPMVGLSFVCDTCDYYKAGLDPDGHCWCDFMTHTNGYKATVDHRQYSPGTFIAWIGLSELNSEAKWNNYFVGNFWRYMFGEVSENYIAARNEIRGWEPIRNQEIGYALDQCKFGLDSEPNLVLYDNTAYGCNEFNCDEHYRKSYNILGDPSIAFYIGKPKKIYIEQNNEPANLALREGITLDDLNFTISLGSGHGGVRLDDAVGVVLYNGGSDIDEDWITLTKSYSDDNGIMEFNIPDGELPVGEVELFIQINRYQHWPVNFRVYYNS